jgi:hypothetical protein
LLDTCLLCNPERWRKLGEIANSDFVWLAGVPRVFGSELCDEGPRGNHVRLFVAHGGELAVEALLVELFEVHEAAEQLSRWAMFPTCKIAPAHCSGCEKCASHRPKAAP